MSEFIKDIYGLHLSKWSVGSWLILYLVAIFMMLYDSKRFDKNERSLSLSMWLILILLYNPLMIRLFVPAIIPGVHDYSRISWGNLTVPITAFVITVYAIDCMKEKKRYAITAIVAILFVLLAGETTVSYVAKPNNIYKIPEESIEIVELMNGYDTGKERPKAVVIHDLYSEDIQTPGEIGKIRLGIRGYSYKYIVPLGIPGKEEEYADSDFLITGNGEDKEVLQKMRFEFIGSVGPCDIYLNPSYVEK